MTREEISNITLALMICSAVAYDVVQMGLTAIPFIGWILSPLVGFFAFLTFYCWFKFYGRDFATPKRALAMGAGFIIEIFPILNALPGWTVAVIFLAGLERAEAVASRVLREGGLAERAINTSKRLAARKVGAPSRMETAKEST